MSIRTQYIGSEGAAFERLGMVFEAMGYRKPSPEFEGARGNYVQNIINEYRSDLTEDEVLQAIERARSSREDLRAMFSGMSTEEAESFVLDRR